MPNPEHPHSPETPVNDELGFSAHELQQDPRFVAEFPTLAEAIAALVDALGWDPELIPEHDPARPDPVLEMLYRDVFDLVEVPSGVRVYRR